MVLGLALSDPPKADPNSLDPLATHPRIMLRHKWHFTTPVSKPKLPIAYRTEPKPKPFFKVEADFPHGVCTHANPTGRFTRWWVKRPLCEFSPSLMTPEWSHCTHEYRT